MTVEALAKTLSLTPLHVADPARDIDGAYIGDLLSWVMGRAKADSVWITIMSNVNVCAVASLADVACVILAEGAEPDPPALDAARQRGINLYASEKTAYALAAALAACGI